LAECIAIKSAVDDCPVKIEIEEDDEDIELVQGSNGACMFELRLGVDTGWDALNDEDGGSFSLRGGIDDVDILRMR
jgi:hypothetical protein